MARASPERLVMSLQKFHDLFLWVWVWTILPVQAQWWPRPAAPLAARISPFPAATPAPSPASAFPIPAAGPASNGTGVLDPSQVAALQSLGFAVGPDVCTSRPTQIQCDNGAPVQHVTLLGLQYCPPGASLSEAALANLSTLTSLSLLNCPASAIVPWPRALALSLTSFTVSASLGRTAEHPELDPLPGWRIGQLHDLHQLTVLDVMLSEGSAYVIFSSMTKLTALTIRNADLSGPFPAIWTATNLTTLNLSNNSLVGPLSPNLALLTQLTQLDLQLNVMSGSIPEAIGELRSLDTLRLNGNLFSGSVPASIANLSNLAYLDLSNNRLNGSLPASIATLSVLRYLDVSNNSFSGAIPFSSFFLTQLSSFRAAGNAQLCYNSTEVAAKFAGGLPPCHSNGLLAVLGSGPVTFAPTAPPKAHAGHPVPGPVPHAKPRWPLWLVFASTVGVLVIVIVVIVTTLCWTRTPNVCLNDVNGVELPHENGVNGVEFPHENGVNGVELPAA